jgi:hypothetical protein
MLMNSMQTTLAAITLSVVPYLADACLVMFGVLDPSSAVHTVLFAPLALNELVLAVWLLAKGFRVPSPADLPHS